MKKCPICGEQYADTYRRCPFCEEDERANRRRQRYAGGGRRYRGDYEESASGGSRGGGHSGGRYVAPPPPPRGSDYDEYNDRRDEYHEDEYRDGYDEYDDYDDYAYDDNRAGSGDLWFKIIMGILIAIILACLLYLGRGIIGNMISGNNPVDIPSSSQDDNNPPANPDDGTAPGVDDSQGRYDPTKPNIPESNTPGTTPDPGTTDPDPTTSPEPTTPDTTTPNTTTPNTTTPNTTTTTANAKDVLSHADVSINIGETFNLKTKGTTTKPSYTSADSSIATVDSSGKVTGVKKGTTKVIVTWDGTKAECIVRVKGSETATENGGDTVSTAPLKLNKEDFTESVGKVVTLKVEGDTTGVTWSVADSSIATVDANGKVTCVKAGTTTVTATRNGQTAKCIVRVKNG